MWSGRPSVRGLPGHPVHPLSKLPTDRWVAERVAEHRRQRWLFVGSPGARSGLHVPGARLQPRPSNTGQYTRYVLDGARAPSTTMPQWGELRVIAVDVYATAGFNCFFVLQFEPHSGPNYLRCLVYVDSAPSAAAQGRSTPATAPDPGTLPETVRNTAFPDVLKLQETIGRTGFVATQREGACFQMLVHVWKRSQLPCGRRACQHVAKERMLYGATPPDAWGEESHPVAFKPHKPCPNRHPTFTLWETLADGVLQNVASYSTQKGAVFRKPTDERADHWMVDCVVSYNVQPWAEAAAPLPQANGSLRHIIRETESPRTTLLDESTLLIVALDDRGLDGDCVRIFYVLRTGIRSGDGTLRVVMADRPSHAVSGLHRCRSLGPHGVGGPRLARRCQ